MDVTKLSLAAQFDDLCRLTNGLLTFDLSTSFREFVKAIKPIQDELIVLRTENVLLKGEVSTLKQQLDTNERKLKTIRIAFNKEIASKNSLKNELQASCKKIDEIRQILGVSKVLEKSPFKEKLEFLISASGLPTIAETVDSTDDSLSDVSFDKSDDDLLDVTHRASIYQDISMAFAPETTMVKQIYDSKPRLSPCKESSGLVNGLVNGIDGKSSPSTKSNSSLVNGKSTSSLVNGCECKNSPINSPKKSASKLTNMVEPLITASTLKSSVSATSIRSQAISLVDELEFKKHELTVKPTLVQSETCSGCLQRLTLFRSYKRCIICNMASHMTQSCIDKMPLPCLKRLPNKKKKPCTFVSIATYAPVERPCIPPILIYCVQEIEKRGLSTPFVYLQPMSGNESKLVREFIEGKKQINMTTLDIIEISNVVKEFLTLLKEPLISFVFWRDFASTVDLVSEDERAETLLELIAKLPGPNIDTIAYLMRHFHHVIQHKCNQVEVESLVKIFSPYFIGYPSKEPTRTEVDRIKHNKLQTRLMESLIRDIDPVEWDKCLLTTVDNGNTVKNKWLIRTSNVRASNGSRRVSHVLGGTCEYGRIERATNKEFS